MKPRGYWNDYDKCRIEAEKYTTKTDFCKNSKSAYDSARRNGWLTEICVHMIEKKKPNGYWTKDKCHTEALKCNSRSEFEIKSPSAYKYSIKNNWIDDICSHMVFYKKPKKYWTFDKCKIEALKYRITSDFKSKAQSAYMVAKENKWLDVITQHMTKRLPPNYWNEEACLIESLKYDTKCSFRINSSSAYYSAMKNGWLKNFPLFKESDTIDKKRCIYVYEFSDNHAYIGLTHNIKDRDYRHLNGDNSAVSIHINDDENISYKLIQLTEYVEANNAIKFEEYFVNLYKNNGWIILNRAKTGSLGGVDIIWTYDKCKEEALKYNTKIDFREKSCGAYNAARRNNWLSDVCSHMKVTRKPPNYWTYEMCKKEALKYKTKTNFQKNSKGAYLKSMRKKWLSDICDHMK